MMKLKKYECSECKEVFLTLFDHHEHFNIHTGEHPFMCAICNFRFSTINDYIAHTKKHEFLRVPTCKDSNFPTSVKNEYSNENQNESNHIMTVPDSSIGSTIDEKRLESTALQSEDILSMADSSNEDFILRDSKKRKHSRSKSYCCNICNIKFKSGKKLNEHRKVQHNYVCQNCNAKYSSQEKLMKHMCFASSEGEPFKCSCSKSFVKSEDFKAHIGGKPYACCSCSMQFNRITNLIRHIRTHTKQKPYICKQCGRGFSQSANLRNHATIHFGVKAVKCDECNFSCKTISGLIKHKKKHKEGYMKEVDYVDRRKMSTGIFSCPICGKEFPFKRNMGMHLKIHKKNECLCQECGKVFDCKSKLTTHYKACHGVPSECQICGKTFASSILLAAHKKIHVIDKKFSCNLCCKTFSIKNYLVQHMKTHSEGKQYSCDKCGKFFKVAKNTHLQLTQLQLGITSNLYSIRNSEALFSSSTNEIVTPDLELPLL